MRRLLLASVLVSITTTVPAIAHRADINLCRPYAIIMTCDSDMPSCGRPHMVYAPGQSLAGNPAGKYFYMTPGSRDHDHDADDRLATAYAVPECHHIHTWWPAG